MTLLLLALLACADDEVVPTESGVDCPEDTGYSPADQPSEDFLADTLPVVVSSIPQAGDQAVDPGLTRIAVTFSKDMNGGGASWVTVSPLEFPESGKAEFINARTSTIEVELEPDTSYGVGTNGGNFQNFQDTDGNAALPWILAFRTAPE